MTDSEVWRIAAAVPDPELPMVTIGDLGILRSCTVTGPTAAGETEEVVEVTITPTYSGCPAMAAIATDVRRALEDAGHPRVRVRTVLAPAWTSDWLTERGRAALAAAGIAPPEARPASPGPVALPLGRRCPQCDSTEVAELSRYGSTSCKSLWRCSACAEPFEAFKSL